MAGIAATTQKRSDEELIESFQLGHLEAFDILVGRYKDQLTNYIFRYLGNRDDAEDIVQETFVRVYQKRDLYKPIAKFSTWIYTIATNLARTQYRRKKRWSIFSLTPQRQDHEVEEYDIPDDSNMPDRATDRALQQGIIERAGHSGF